MFVCSIVKGSRHNFFRPNLVFCPNWGVGGSLVPTFFFCPNQLLTMPEKLFLQWNDFQDNVTHCQCVECIWKFERVPWLCWCNSDLWGWSTDWSSQSHAGSQLLAVATMTTWWWHEKNRFVAIPNLDWGIIKTYPIWNNLGRSTNNLLFLLFLPHKVSTNKYMYYIKVLVNS